MPGIISGSSSPFGHDIDLLGRENYERLQESEALGGLKASGLLQSLAEIYEECSSEGWDGENAKPVSGGALLNALIFLNYLPLGTKLPEISPEVDGSFAFDWYKSPRQVLSVSIDANGGIHYAALIGMFRRSGTDFVQGGISEDLITLINRIMEK